MAGVATTKMSSKGQKDTVIFKAISAPTLADVDELVSEARRQARQAVMKPPRSKLRGIVFCSGPSFRA